MCVYTYDCEDENDVMKIRDHLRGMGFKKAASYKNDEQTIVGIYFELSAGFALYKA